MTALTPEGDRLVADLSRRYGLSQGAVRALLEALVAGGGNQAQFNHPDLGGMGQWSQGGMTMVGDMFNNALKSQVDGVLSELAGAMGRSLLVQRRSQGQGQGQGYGQRQSQSQGYGQGQGLAGFGFGFQDWGGGDRWWPEGLGTPASVGTQNDMGYAVFPEARRLAVRRGGRVRVFDTGEHRISGVSQSQGSGDTLSFSSQFGTVGLTDLRETAQGSAGGSGGDGGGDGGKDSLQGGSRGRAASAPTGDRAGVPTGDPTGVPTGVPTDVPKGAHADDPGDEPGDEPAAPPMPTRLESGIADALDDLADDHLDDLAWPRTEAASPAPPERAPPEPAPPARAGAAALPGGDDIFAKLERLAELHARGILTDAEFQAKKAELLDRL